MFNFGAFLNFGEIQKSNMADKSWQPFDNHDVITTSYDVADLNGNIFELTISPPSLIVIALIYTCKVMEGGW